MHFSIAFMSPSYSTVFLLSLYLFVYFYSFICLCYIYFICLFSHKKLSKLQTAVYLTVCLINNILWLSVHLYLYLSFWNSNTFYSSTIKIKIVNIKIKNFRNSGIFRVLITIDQLINYANFIFFWPKFRCAFIKCICLVYLKKFIKKQTTN